MDDKQRAEVLWAYSITHERIMERLVRKGYFSQEKADVILDMLFDQISKESIELFSNSDGCKKTIASLLNPEVSPDGFISLTEIARAANSDNPSYVIQSWLRSRNTIEFLRMWEKDNNPDFRDDECNRLIEQLKLPSFTLTPKKWIVLTDAKEIVSKQGNNGGTLSHRDIALDFQLWLDPAKRYEVIKLISKVNETE